MNQKQKGFTPHHFLKIAAMIKNHKLNFFHRKNGAGFTLIELLVVIAVIGLLASIVMVGLNSARLKARNAKRISDLRQIQKALDLYYDANGAYPLAPSWRSQCVGYGGYSADNVIPGLVPTYLVRFPADPSMNISTSAACYLYNSDGTDYKLLDHDIVSAEVNTFSYQAFPELFDPSRDSGTNGCVVDGSGFWSWAVYTPKAVCW